MTTTEKSSKPVAYATPIDGHGTVYNVTYDGCADCDREVCWGYLERLALDGHQVFVAASQADGDRPCTLAPYTAHLHEA